MSEEQKYYTPAPEDLRVGFECEILKWVDGTLVPEKWEERIISAKGTGIQMEIAINRIKKSAIRVPYLTKEQIEAEGWQVIGEDAFIKPINAMCEFIMRWDTDDDSIIIEKHLMDYCVNIYSGTCRCVNDIRQISKLLGI